MMNWICTRCGAECITIHDLECGMPDYLVPVPYETGIEMEHPACPLAPLGVEKQ